MVPGWVIGARPDVQGKGGENHHVRSALNPSSASEIIAVSHKMSVLEECER